MQEYDQLNVSHVLDHEGHWWVLLEVNGEEWKRFGPWDDQDTAKLYADEALRRAQKVADKLKMKYDMREPTDEEMTANLGKIMQACRDFNQGKLTRAECRRKLTDELRVHEHKLDELLDTYDPTK
jgi:hypothetical protein